MQPVKVSVRLGHGVNWQQLPVLQSPSGHGDAAFLGVEQKGFGTPGDMS